MSVRAIQISFGRTKRTSGNVLAMMCAGQYPFQELIEALDPKAVFIAKANDDSRKLLRGLE